MKYLITGASGYIGSNIISKLTNKGNLITGITHTQKPDKIYDDVTFLNGDISKKSFIDTWPKDFDFIIHCASLVKDYGRKKRFYEVNVQGTKNLVFFSKKVNIEQFIYLGHIQYESTTYFNYYSETKEKAQNFLKAEFEKNQFPVTIICPGNVFGPGATIWLTRVIKILLEKKLYLINDGNGIFHHTYIDNLLDAIFLSIKNKSAIGHILNITDGDDSITFKKYFMDLAKILGVSNSFKTLSKNSALTIGYVMILLNKISGIKPVVSPLAVEIMTNQMPVSIKPAKEILGYEPRVNYTVGMENIEKWIKKKYG